MLYKPEYCSHCGEKIERIEWFPWTSRRFCEVCETEFKLTEWLPRAVMVGFFLIGVFGFGSYLKSGGRTLRVESASPAAISPAAADHTGAVNKASNRLVAQAANNGAGSVPYQAGNDVRPQAPGAAEHPIKQAAEPVYFCGAQTKKGSPCSRRVRGGGRCWQHQGQPAMLPAGKLTVKQ